MQAGEWQWQAAWSRETVLFSCQPPSELRQMSERAEQLYIMSRTVTPT
jgi:hypothetical protein